jgi:hypothetical protein
VSDFVIVRPLLALALAQLVGALLRAAPAFARGQEAPGHARRAFLAALASPASALVALALTYGASLGLAGAPLVAALAAALLWPLRSDEPEEIAALPRPVAFTCAGVLAAVLARPMVPTCWDEFVWLGKARFESEGFGAGVRAALDPAAHLMPPGYPTLWPAASGWLALGADDLGAITGGASTLVALAVALFLERAARAVRAAEGAEEGSASLGLFRGAALAIAAPIVLVHLRTTYVDLPLGLLGAALFFELAASSASPSPVVAASLAVALVGIKDEGAAHLAAAVLGAAYARGVRLRDLPRAFAFTVGAGAVALGTWQLLVSAHGIGRDHGGFSPAISWAARLPLLLAAHATELTSWGLVWPAVVVAGVHARRERPARAIGIALAVNLACVAAMLAFGPPRVRAFAENGTLLNRVLVQLWPLGAALVLEAARGVRRPSRP